jgi:hypothetical protein
MSAINQTADVGRKKESDPYRERMQITLHPEVAEALRAQSEATDAPISRLVERAVRESEWFRKRQDGEGS